MMNESNFDETATRRFWEEHPDRTNPIVKLEECIGVTAVLDNVVNGQIAKLMSLDYGSDFLFLVFLFSKFQYSRV